MSRRGRRQCVSEGESEKFLFFNKYRRANKIRVVERETLGEDEAKTAFYITTITIEDQKRDNIFLMPLCDIS